jgi:hypothetical protein
VTGKLEEGRTLKRKKLTVSEGRRHEEMWSTHGRIE